VLRPDARSTIDALKALGLEVSMLTGDNAAEACRISTQLGIAVTAACATPDVKLEHVRSLQQQGHKVMMVLRRPASLLVRTLTFCRSEME